MVAMVTQALSDIPGGVVDWSATGLLALVVVLILTDRLVTRGRLMEERAEKKIAQARNETLVETNRELTAAVKAHIETALLNKRVMEAVQEKHQVADGDDA